VASAPAGSRPGGHRSTAHCLTTAQATSRLMRPVRIS
jgi:hypothetical protein